MVVAPQVPLYCTRFMRATTASMPARAVWQKLTLEILSVRCRVNALCVRMVKFVLCADVALVVAHFHFRFKCVFHI